MKHHPNFSTMILISILMVALFLSVPIQAENNHDLEAVLDTPEKVLSYSAQKHMSSNLTRLLLKRFRLPSGITAAELEGDWTSKNMFAASILNVRINDYSGDLDCPSGQDETTVSVARDRVLAAWNDSEGFRTNPYTVSGYGLSIDGGSSFADRGQQPAPGGPENLSNGGDPDIEFYSETIAYFSYIAYNNVTFYRNYVGVNKSTDGGLTFSYSGKVRGPNAASGGFTDKSFMAVDKTSSSFDGNVYLSWTDMGFSSSQICVSRSTDGGVNFLTPVSLDTGSLQGSFPLVAANGDVYVAWWDGGIKVRKSTNGGVSFLPESVVAASAPDPGNSSGWLANTRIRCNPYPLMAAHPTDPQRVYITWAANPAGTDQSDVYFSMTDNGGGTWRTPVRVNGDATTTDQFFPSVAADTAGNIAVVYYDRRNDLTNTWIDVTVSVSIDDGVSFPYEQTINDVSFRAVGDTSSGYAIGDYNHTAAQGMDFHTVWGDGRRLCSGEPDQDVYYARFTARDITGVGIPATVPWMLALLVGIFTVMVSGMNPYSP